MIDIEPHRQSALGPDEPTFVTEEGIVNSAFRVGSLLLEAQGTRPETSIQVIAIAEIADSKILVAVPLNAWHKRKAAERILNARIFTKPCLLEVAVVQSGDREATTEDVNMKLWTGFLSKDYFDAVDFSLEEVEADVCFTASSPGTFFPYAYSLVEVANEHYSFFSAAEDTPKEDAEPARGEGELGSPDLQGRMEQMEFNMAKLMEGMDQLIQRQGGPQTPRVTFAASSSPSTAMPAAKVKAAPGRPSALRKPAQVPPSPVPLDAGVVAAAMQAGVGDDVLQEISRLMSKNVKAVKVKDLNAAARLDPLSEFEEEDEIEDGEFGVGSAQDAGGGDPLQQAVVQLANIMKVLTEDKKRRTSSKLELALDYSGSGSTDASAVGTGKRSAAARRALRSMLLEHPEEIYGLLERMMAEDMMSLTLPPGVNAPMVTARAWVEHRSRIGAYRTLAHAAWGVAGALDCCKKGDVAGTRARLNLLLLQLDQSAVDRGNWQLAAELSLENVPPFASLLQHNPPAEGEAPYSRLLDARWAEISLSHLRDQDDFQTRRKALTRGKKEDTDADGSDSWKKRPKAKAKAKAPSEGDK